MATKNGYQLILTDDFKTDYLIKHTSKTIYLDDYKEKQLVKLNHNQFVQQLAHLTDTNCYQDFRCNKFYDQPKSIQTINIDLNNPDNINAIKHTVHNWLLDADYYSHSSMNTNKRFEFQPNYQKDGINDFYYEYDLDNQISIYTENSYTKSASQLLDAIKEKLIARHHLSEQNQSVYHANIFEYQSGLKTAIVTSNNDINSRTSCILPLRIFNQNKNALKSIDYRFNNQNITQITDYPFEFNNDLQNSLNRYAHSLTNTDIENDEQHLEPLFHTGIPSLSPIDKLATITGMDSVYQHRIELLKTSPNYQNFVKNLK